VSKRYGPRIALDNVSLSIRGGEITGLIGPNGAGKTTLLRIAAGLVRPSAGRATWATESLVYFAGEQTLPRHVSAAAWRALWRSPYAPASPKRRFGILSRGTRQRLGLDAALARGAAVLLLDEPWEGLDPDASRWLTSALLARRRSGTAIVVSSHRLHDLAAVCDRAVFLASGRIRDDRPFDHDAPLPEREGALYDAFHASRGH
jgi:ABC-2 type transport system ATP-binding protein